MARYLSLAFVVAAGIGVSAPSTQTQRPPASVAACRHDSHEQNTDRARRQSALALAKAINEAEGTFAERTRGYRPLNALRNLPPVPSGFDVRLYTDGAGYVVSLKDTIDPCRYGIFSDESGFLYEHTPQRAPIIATGS
jgi:hypothetical protein